MKPCPAKVFASTVLCLFLASCAQTGPPLPPSLELPKPPTDLRASRKGSRITLSWSEPVLTTDRQSVRYLGPTLICRSTQIEISVCGNQVAMTAAPAAVATKSASGRGTRRPQLATPVPQTYTDILPSAMQHPDPSDELTYAVEVLNRNARGAGLSNRVHVPAVITLPPPSDLTAKLTADGVVLRWTSAGWTSAGPLQNLPSPSGSSSPHLRFQYRIYRREESSGKDAVAGEIPDDVSGPLHFTDTAFEWEKTYLYRITTVSTIQQSENEIQVEGDDSDPIRVVAHDIFPPATPAGLQAAYSGEGQKPFIDLIWAPVTSADLAGYNVYRRAGDSAAVKLNSELVKTPAYRDTAVASGKTYTYAISAVDGRGNESPRSQDSSESVP